MGDEIRDKNCLSSPTKWQHERWRCPQTSCFCNKSERGDALVSNTTWRSINQKPIHPFSSESCCHISSSERLHREPLKIELSAFSFYFYVFSPSPADIASIDCFWNGNASIDAIKIKSMTIVVLSEDFPHDLPHYDGHALQSHVDTKWTNILGWRCMVAKVSTKWYKKGSKMRVFIFNFLCEIFLVNQSVNLGQLQKPFEVFFR